MRKCCFFVARGCLDLKVFFSRKECVFLVRDGFLSRIFLSFLRESFSEKFFGWSFPFLRRLYF